MAREKKHNFKFGKPRPFSAADLVRHVVLGWLLAAAAEFLLLSPALRDLSGLEGLAQMRFGRVVGITCVLAAVLTVLSGFADIREAERWGIVGAFGVLAVCAVLANGTLPFMVICALIFLGLLVYRLCGWNDAKLPASAPKKTDKLWLWLTAGLAAAFFAFVSVWTVARVLSFSAPTYDFGIFAQMFYNMKESGLPLTTVERDGLLSHFHVHMSPIYYLMLPFYCIVPRPETIQVLQAAVMASAVIPLWLIGKHHGLSGLQRTLLCAVLLLAPAFSGGAGYDIHENCFLTPLLLWLLYALDRGSIPGICISAALTLTVKEDAAMYVAVIALYGLARTVLRKDGARLRGIVVCGVLLGGALAWFAAVTGYLAEVGDGVMTYRYNNFIYDGSGSLLTVVKAVILCPMKAVYECVDAEKLTYIAQTMLPLLCLPLLTCRYERYLLLIPYVLVNLMSDYQYQHNVMFQYNFGSTACLVYLAAVNLADFKVDWHRAAALGAAAVVSAGFFASVIVPTAVRYPKQAVQYADYYDGVRSVLDKVPEGASVSATTFYTAYLSDREVLYDIRYAAKEHVLETEYVVLKKSSSGEYKRYATGGQDNGYENLVALLEKNGYTLWEEYPGVLAIYHKSA